MLRWASLARLADFRAKTFALLAGMGPRQVERRVGSLLGVQPRDWFHRLLVRKAEETLLSGRSVKEAASAVGLAHASSLRRLFKRSEGLTIGEFLARVRDAERRRS